MHWKTKKTYHSSRIIQFVFYFCIVFGKYWGLTEWGQAWRLNVWLSVSRYARSVPYVLTSRHSQPYLIELNFNRTQSNSVELNPWIEFDWVRTHTKKNWAIELNRTFDFRNLDIYKTGVQGVEITVLEARVSVFRSRRHHRKMVSAVQMRRGLLALNA